MKNLILLLALPMTFMTSAFADMTDQHLSLCDREDVKQIKGERGSCQLVIVPAETPNMSGKCQGNLGGMMACTIAYAASNYGAAVMFRCEDFGETMQAEAASHRAVALVSDDSGNEKMVQDKNTYTVISSGLIDINISSDGPEKKHDISFNLQGMKLPVEDLKCN